jgi:antitoxin (DNA-binding transcriptional repressor) of toxin-antitoxin stability system
MATNVDFRELPARFVELLDLARSGTEVVVTDGAIPQARLVPLTTSGPRIPDLHAGMVDIAPDFDDPLPDEFWGGRT